MSFKMGVDLGGTKTEFLILDDGNQPQYRERRATPATDYDAIIEMIADEYAGACNRFGVKPSLGIGMPGAQSPNSGLIRNANTQCLNGRALQRDLERRIGQPLRLANDANCFALSEALDGAGRGYRVVFGVIIGTGTGGGLVVDGHLLAGPHLIAGEWGHNPLPWWRPEDGETDCYCGKQGCIETYLSGPGLAASYARREGVDRDSRTIVAAAGQGDAVCLDLLLAYSDQLARALASVINLVDPDAIVLGGGMSNIDAIYQEVPRRLPQYVFSDFVETPIVKAERGDSSGVFGAALLWE